MRFPIAIELGDTEQSFGVAIPDLSGCFSAGDTLDEAIDNAKEAIEFWLEIAIDDGVSLPEPQHLSVHLRNPEFHGWIWAVVSVDLAKLSDQVQRVNITLPSRVLRRIDAAAKSAGESRSGFLAHLALRG